ncbi:hypothetical protein NP233_g6455 [Leucocoprinus birnbaumii]|uniref:Uncharacterized protein n=1 Tax=Leucocoprinus birnbaumii TaxID=56174 RepID=A0AAD5VWK1_9AGAR|nr:hypothetical protein NP233_g6455 [Leucocoprinus birnbaumii]
MASSRRVVVDDTDDSIVYIGAWFLDASGSQDNVGNFGPPYMGTLHGISTIGSVLFNFSGTDIAVWGTNNEANLNENPDPDWECFVDGNSIGRDSPFRFPENNWRFCEKSGLPDGSHTLRIDVKVQNPSQTFWLDSIRYAPSPTAPLSNTTIFIDNTDPAVQFDPLWKSLGHTANVTSRHGSTANVTFMGTSISWYAFIPTELPHDESQGSWSIDGGAPNKFLLKGISDQQSSSLFNQLYFTTPELSDGQHTLTVTFLGNRQTTPLCLDYLYVRNGHFGTSTHALGTSTTMSVPSSLPTITQNSGISNPGFPSSSESTSRGAPAGAIVGGVIGGLVLLICTAAGLLFRRRRQQTNKQRKKELLNTTPTQFPLYYPETHGGISGSTAMPRPDSPSSSPPSPLNSLTSPAYMESESGLPWRTLYENEKGGYGIYHDY